MYTSDLTRLRRNGSSTVCRDEATWSSENRTASKGRGHVNVGGVSLPLMSENVSTKRSSFLKGNKLGATKERREYSYIVRTGGREGA